jgi:hypothetical protein
MKIVKIKVSSQEGSVTVRVTCPRFPESVAGIIWRYNADQEFDQKAGDFQTQHTDVPLGSPETIAGKLFLVEGAVINQNSNPPSPYQVVVSIIQNGKTLHEEVPTDNGTGKIADKNIAFIYRFGLETA